MKVEILAQAADELNAAIAYYEEIEPGLGLRFKAEVGQLLIGSFKIPQ